MLQQEGIQNVTKQFSQHTNVGKPENCCIKLSVYWEKVQPLITAHVVLTTTKR